MNIKENYQQYVSRYASEVAALKRKNTGFITGELLAFGGILAFLICYFALDGDTQNYLMGAVLCLIAYLGIRRIDDKNKEKIEHLSALLKVYQDEIKALEGDFSPFETGDSYQNRSILIPSTSMSSERVRCSTASAELSLRAVRRHSPGILPGKRLWAWRISKEEGICRRNWLEKAKTGGWNSWHLAKRTET